LLANQKKSLKTLGRQTVHSGSIIIGIAMHFGQLLLAVHGLVQGLCEKKSGSHNQNNVQQNDDTTADTTSNQPFFPFSSHDIPF